MILGWIRFILSLIVLYYFCSAMSFQSIGYIRKYSRIWKSNIHSTFLTYRVGQNLLHQVNNRNYYDDNASVKSAEKSQYDGNEEDWGENGIHVEHLITKQSKIAPYWIKQLRRIEKPIAIDLISQLTPDNALGYKKPTGEEAKSGTMAKQAVDEKERHVDKVILFRCGEFYETYGIDAIMLVAYCGLNPMGSKCRAGCPVKNIQNTLDRLTENGLSAAVYEEVEEMNVNRGPTKRSKLKNRVLMQIVSPAYSTYTYDRCLQGEDIEFRTNRPIVGVFHINTGYILCEAHIDERKIIISERLTEESVQSLIAVSGCIEPIYLANDIHLDKTLSFLQDYSIQKIRSLSNNYDVRILSDQLIRQISRDMELDLTTFRYSTRDYTNRPRPIYKSTALQIGLMKNENVPNLVSFLLTKRSYAYSQRFLYQWILNPPSQILCDQMQNLCRALATLQVPLTRCQPVLEGKVVSLILAKQCNAPLFNDIRTNIHAVLDIVSKGYDLTSDILSSHPYSSFLPSLSILSESQSGIRFDTKTFYTQCRQVLDEIDRVVVSSSISNSIDKVDSTENIENTESIDILNNQCRNIDLPTDPYNRIPKSFFQQNEELIHNRVKATANPDIEKYFDTLFILRKKLCDTISREYPKEVDIGFDIFENQLFFKTSGKQDFNVECDSDIIFISAPEDRTRKQNTSKRSRMTTENAKRALSEYLDHVEAGPKMVQSVLQDLCTRLSGNLLNGIIQACHFSIILQTINNHVASSYQKGWELPILVPFSSSTSQQSILLELEKERETRIENYNFQPQSSETKAWKCSNHKNLKFFDHKNGMNSRPILQIKELSPYWIDRTKATKNNVDLNGVMLLTAPNMSGKTTLMRSVLTIALLANCGLFTPCSSTSVIPRFDCYFLRTASYDIPSEEKSAFAVEMDDVRIVLRDATSRSLVMMDEIGKGTSSRDGSALAGALLEYFSEQKVYIIFATHLHEVLSLPLKLKSDEITYKRMGYIEDLNSDSISWTYELLDGQCTDSMAMHTAKIYGISSPIINRAKELGNLFDSVCRPNTITPPFISKTIEPKNEETVMSLKSSSSSNETIVSTRKYSLNEIIPMTREFSDKNTIPILIRSDQDPPASLESKSCVYILHIQSTNKGADQLYVGETESIRQRLQQHRKKRKSMYISALVIVVSDKSNARLIETNLILKLRKEGYDIEQDKDSSHTLFGSARLFNHSYKNTSDHSGNRNEIKSMNVKVEESVNDNTINVLYSSNNTE